MEKKYSKWLREKKIETKKIVELKNADGEIVLLWIECQNYYQKFFVMTELHTFFYKGGHPRQGIVVWDDRDEGNNCMQFRGEAQTADKLAEIFKRAGSKGFRNEKICAYEWKAVGADVEAVRKELFKILNIKN